MHLTHIRQVALNANEIDQSVTFYRDILGAKHIASFNQAGLAFFDFSGVRLLLEKNITRGAIYFHVDDIEKAHAELQAAGVVFLQEPHPIFADNEGTFGKKGETEWMAFFNDPGGNTLAIASRQ